MKYLSKLKKKINRDNTRIAKEFNENEMFRTIFRLGRNMVFVFFSGGNENLQKNLENQISQNLENLISEKPRKFKF